MTWDHSRQHYKVIEHWQNKGFVNNAETIFGNIPWHKLNIELRERGLRKGNMIQHGVYHKNMLILLLGGESQPVMSKIVDFPVIF